MEYKGVSPDDVCQIYRCLCDLTRLRILNLLKAGPLCVCHLQSALDLPQVKVSKHLAYLRDAGLVRSRRKGQWVVYQLPTKPGRLLDENLRCLQDLRLDQPVFRADLKRLKRTDTSAAACC